MCTLDIGSFYPIVLKQIRVGGESHQIAETFRVVRHDKVRNEEIGRQDKKAERSELRKRRL